MNEAFTLTADLLLPPDPPQYRCSRPLPPATAELLLWLQVLFVYARHLRNILLRQAERGFARIAQCLGATQASFVLTHLTRGILRAIALQRVLLSDADNQPAPAAGNRRRRTPQAAAEQQASRQHPAADRIRGLPTLRQLETAIRHQPVEAVIDDISHDFGVSFSLCEARFGNALRDMIDAYRGIISSFFNERLPRDAVIADAPERNLAFDCPPQKPDAIRYIVGFFHAKPNCGFPFTVPPIAAAKAGAQSPDSA